MADRWASPRRPRPRAAVEADAAVAGEPDEPGQLQGRARQQRPVGIEPVGGRELGDAHPRARGDRRQRVARLDDVGAGDSGRRRHRWPSAHELRRRRARGTQQPQGRARQERRVRVDPVDGRELGDADARPRRDRRQRVARLDDIRARGGRRSRPGGGCGRRVVAVVVAIAHLALALRQRLGRRPGAGSGCRSPRPPGCKGRFRSRPQAGPRSGRRWPRSR